MDFQNIVYSKSDGIATIKINRPDKLNSLSVATWSDIFAALDDTEADADVRVVVITGQGRAFSAGDDIEEFKEISETISSIRLYVRQVVSSMLRVEKLSKPVIAAVNGLAMGGGFELAIASDIVVASEKAKFGLPEGRIGAFAGFAVHRLPQIVGTKKAMEILLTGDPIDAQEALRIGLVNKVVPEAEFDAEVKNMAKRIQTIAPLAATISKGLVNKESGGAEIEESMTAGGLLMTSQDFKEGFDAFLNKRAPVFKGK